MKKDTVLIKCNRRQFLKISYITLFTGLLHGCSGEENNNDTSQPIEYNQGNITPTPVTDNSVDNQQESTKIDSTTITIDSTILTADML